MLKNQIQWNVNNSYETSIGLDRRDDDDTNHCACWFWHYFSDGIILSLSL